MPGKTLYCLGEAWLELNSTAPLASAKTFSPRMGGSAASLALAYAAQGGRASLLTQLGEDAFGHRIADALSTAGVDISRVSFTSRAPENVVNAEREKAEKARALIAKLDESAAAMQI